MPNLSALKSKIYLRKTNIDLKKKILYLCFVFEWMNENLYMAHKKTSTQNLACSQHLTDVVIILTTQALFDKDYLL